MMVENQFYLDYVLWLFQYTFYSLLVYFYCVRQYFRSKSVGKLLSAEIWYLSNILQKNKCSDVHFMEVLIKCIC